MTTLGLHQLTSVSRVCSKNSRAICFRRKRLQKLFKLVFIKYSQAYNFINKETITQMFSCECCEIFKNSFFIEHLQWLFQFLHVKTLELFAALIMSWMPSFCVFEWSYRACLFKFVILKYVLLSTIINDRRTWRVSSIFVLFGKKIFLWNDLSFLDVICFSVSLQWMSLEFIWRVEEMITYIHFFSILGVILHRVLAIQAVVFLLQY